MILYGKKAKSQDLRPQRVRIKTFLDAMMSGNNSDR
jgi:hypothetical protein